MSIDIKDFMDDCRSRGLTNQTIATYKSNITTYLDFVGDPLNIDTQTLRNFLDYLKNDLEYLIGKIKKKGVCSRTVSAYFSAISTYYEYLIYVQKINHNPIPSFTKRYVKVKKHLNGENTRQIISIEQMKKLINLDMPIQHKAILIVLAKTGIRKGELLSIDIDDLNIKKKEIILKPKAKRTNRLVFFDDETAQVLKVFLEWRKTKAKSDALFISKRGLRIKKDKPHEIVTTYGRMLNLHDSNGSLNKKLTPHCFRHWFTTHLWRSGSGMSREFIQELRGDSHKDAFDIYNHLDLSTLKNQYLEFIPKVLDTSIKLHSTDLPKPNKDIPGTKRDIRKEKKKPINRPDTILKRYGQLSKAVLSILKVHPDGLTSPQIAESLKDCAAVSANTKNNIIRSCISKILKRGHIRSDEQKRYFLTTEGTQTLDKILTLTTHQKTNKTPKKTGRPNNKISGFSVDLYAFIKYNEGLKVSEISQQFNKKNDSIKLYLKRLKKYGYLTNQSGRWYLSSSFNQSIRVINTVTDSHFINLGNSEITKNQLIEA